MSFASPHRLPVPPLSALPVDLVARAEVRVDPERSLVTYTIAGLLDGEAVRRLRQRQAAAMGELRCARNQHLTIIDVTACKLQPQDVMETFRMMLADPRYRSRRLAVVIGSSLARMQMRRVLDRDAVGYVATLAEAEAWLFAESD